MKTFKKIRYSIYLIIIIGLTFLHFLIVNPIYFWIEKSWEVINSSSENLKSHVSYLTESDQQRDHSNVTRLNEVADYIKAEFTKNNCDSVEFQTYTANEKEYKNVICKFNWVNPKKIIVWAHYDVDWGWHSDENLENKVFAWADDNASGAAWLLELSRLIGENKSELKNSIEFVGYTLEELPHFRGETMGSYVHAESLKKNNEEIQYMISLEMIWFFSDEKIQRYPIRALSRIYPSEANFITLVWQIWDVSLKDVKYNMSAYSDIDTWSINAPEFIHWVWFSDHKSYWDLWYKAYMITDTSYLRNKNYHKVTDTIDTLDFEKMNEVVKWVYWAITN
jgi:hypothetical protein